jgi:hypothetical protein
VTLVATPTMSLTLVELTECLCMTMAEASSGPVCWCGTYPGAQVSWEYCGECAGDTCGMAYVRLAGIAPYDEFPIPTVDDRCTKPLFMGLEVGVLRCFPQPEDGSLPTDDVLTEVALAQIADAEALYSVLVCCQGIGVGQYVPVGQAGGCVGGFWTAYASVP